MDEKNSRHHHDDSDHYRYHLCCAQLHSDSYFAVWRQLSNKPSKATIALTTDKTALYWFIVSNNLLCLRYAKTPLLAALQPS